MSKPDESQKQSELLNIFRVRAVRERLAKELLEVAIRPGRLDRERAEYLREQLQNLPSIKKRPD